MINKVLRCSLSVLFALLVFLFWMLCHPEALSFNEQNQMFLFTIDYLRERMAVAGCLSDYVSEFLAQFYYYPVCGAAILAVTFLLIQQLSYRIFKSFSAETMVWTPFVLSFYPVLLLWALMGDIDTLLSFPIALLFSLLTYLLCRRLTWWKQGLVSLLLYWLIGPAFAITVLLFVLHLWYSQPRYPVSAIIQSGILIVVAHGWVYLCRTLWMSQYPWDTIIAGINYHRYTLMFMTVPIGYYLTAGSIILLPIVLWLLGNVLRKARLDIIAAACFLLVGCIYAATERESYEPNTYAILRQMYQVRKGDWEAILDQAKQDCDNGLPAVKDPVYCTGVNLALAKTHQMAQHIFEMPQTGMHGLLMPWRREDVSCVNTMEAFYQLGFVNESMRYAFDLQECVPNCRKSCRFTQRMAECNIINGRYDVASKYIDQLKHTLFYSHWAKLADGYLYNDAKVMQNAQWNLLRQFRLENDFLYDYPEMDRMLGQLYLHNRSNQMAYDYFMATLLLEGNYQSYVVNLPQKPQEGQDPFPRGYRQYVEYMQKQVANGNPDVVSGATATR